MKDNFDFLIHQIELTDDLQNINGVIAKPELGAIMHYDSYGVRAYWDKIRHQWHGRFEAYDPKLRKEIRKEVYGKDITEFANKFKMAVSEIEN